MSDNDFDVLTSVETIRGNVSTFIREEKDSHVVQHSQILLCSLEKSYFSQEDVDQCLSMIDQSSKFLLENKNKDYGGLVLENLRRASEIAENSNLPHRQADFNSQIGDICSQGISSTPPSPKKQEANEYVNEALLSYHQAIRDGFNNGLDFKTWSRNFIKVSELEIRQYYDLVKDFLIDQGKNADKSGSEAVEEYFGRIDRLGEKLIELNEIDRAWELYMSTQQFVLANIDISYLNRFAQIGTLFQHPAPLTLIDQNVEVEENPLYEILDNISLPGKWKEYKSQLEKNRLIFDQETNFVKAEEKFIESTKVLICTILEDCIEILGQKPCEYTICCCGSFSNKTITPYSDFEYALLIEDQSKFSGTEKLYNRNYFALLNQLFLFKFNSIGEVSPAGFHLDSEGYPLVETRLMGTPEELLRHTSLDFANSYDDHLSFSIYHAAYLYGSQRLFKQFDLLRKQWLLKIQDDDCLHRIVGSAFLKYHLTTFKSFNGNLENDFDLKKTFYLLLNTVMLDLAIYNNFASTAYEFNFSNAFLKLRSQHKISNTFASSVDQAFYFILKLRIRVQRVNQQQLEIVHYLKGEGVKLTDDEYSYLKGIYYGVFRPLYWCVDQLITAQQWHSDPAEGMFQNNIEALSDRTKPYDKQSLHDAIQAIIYSYALQKASPDKYYKCLSQLPDIHHAYFVNQVKEAESLLNSDIGRQEHILRVLNYFPQEDGRRPQIKLNEAKWFDSLKSIVSDKKPGGFESVCLDSVSRDEKSDTSMIQGFLNGECIRQIIEQQPSFFDDDCGYVCRIEVNGYVFYLKKQPYAPGVEYAANLFNVFFFGLDFIHCELFRFTVGLLNSNTFPVSIVGGDFHQLKPVKYLGVSENLDAVDKNVFSLSVLSAILTRANQISAENVRYYSFANRENVQKQAFVSQFHEGCFSIPFNTESELARNPTLSMQLKTILFTYTKLMKRPVSKETKDELCRLEVSRVLDNWVLALKKQYQSYMHLLGQQDTQDIDRWLGEGNAKYFSDFFSSDFLYKLYDKITLMQRTLKDGQNITHAELLAHMDPVVAFYYFQLLPKQLKNISGTVSTKELFDLLSKSFVLPKDRLNKFIRTECRFFNPVIPDFMLFQPGQLRSKPAKIHADLNFLRQDALKIESAINDAQFGRFDIYAQLGLAESRDKVMAVVDCSILDDAKVRVMVKILGERSHKCLRLANCKHLRDSDVATILKVSPDLDELDVSGCENLSSSVVGIIAENCSNIRKLNISGLVKITNVGVSETKAKPYFARLTELTMNDCSLIKKVNISASKLQFLSARNSLSLEEIQVNSCQLSHVSFDGSPNLTDAELVGLLSQSDKTIDRVDVRDCSNIKLRKLYEIYLSLNCTKSVPTKLAEVLLQPIYTDIDLSGSVLGRFHMIALIQYLGEKKQPINRLNLSKCSFTLEAEKLLVEMLTEQAQVKILMMNGVKTQQFLENIIVDILIDNHSIASVHLADNELNDESLRYMLPYLQVNPFLWELNLDGNRITDRGIALFTNMLTAKPSIAKFSFSKNQIDISGWQNIVLQLRENRNVISCTMENNPCFAASGYFEDSLEALLKKNNALTHCAILNEQMNSGDSGVFNMKKSSSSLMIKQAVESTKRRDSRLRSASKRMTVADAQLNKETLDCFLRLQGSIKSFIDRNLEKTEELINAVIIEDEEKVKSLCSAGVSPIAIAQSGNTALHIAASCSRENILNYFFEIYVNLNAVNSDNQTVFDLNITNNIRKSLNDFRLKVIEENKRQSLRRISKSNSQDRIEAEELAKFLLRWFPDGVHKTNEEIEIEEDDDAQSYVLGLKVL